MNFKNENTSRGKAERMYGKCPRNRDRRLHDHCSRFISPFDGIAVTNVISGKQISETELQERQ